MRQIGSIAKLPSDMPSPGRQNGSKTLESTRKSTNFLSGK